MEAFDHVSRSQLLKGMIQLGIDGDLIVWTSSFLTDRKMQIVIDGHAWSTDCDLRSSGRIGKLYSILVSGSHYNNWQL